MSFTDWVEGVRRRYQKQGARDATVDSIHELYIGGLRRLKEVQNPEFESHWDREWDILCILDACRVDMFRAACDDYSWLPASDSVGSLYSTGSTSHEWMKAMFGEDRHAEMADTAYLTGNLFVEHIDSSPFAHLEVHPPRSLEEEGGIYTVPPNVLTDAAIRYWREADQCGRLIIHYMQPHTPFRSRPEWFDAHADKNRELRTTWGQGFAELRDGDLPRAEFMAAYRDNLDWVLSEVDRLRQNADGKIALSADHANGLGEWGVFGHPEGINVPAVREVPFATVTGHDSRESDPDEPERERTVSDDVSEQLRRLGYKE